MDQGDSERFDSVLCGADILRLLGETDARKALSIVPLAARNVDPKEASVDLHLGHHFLVPRRPEVAAIAPRKLSATEGRPIQPEEVALEQLWLPAGQPIHLHPREFLLAATLEYVGLPPSLCAEVMGRSRWARVGLIVEMASFVHPGYHGCLTLEMQNLGSAPIVLEPYLRVAHLVVTQSTSQEETPPRSQITCAIRPEFWPLASKRDRDLLERLAPPAPPLGSPDQ